MSILTEPRYLEHRHRRKNVIQEKVKSKPRCPALGQGSGRLVKEWDTYMMMFVTIVIHPIAMPRVAYGNEPVRSKCSRMLSRWVEV